MEDRFFTRVIISNPPHKIDYETPVLLIGSCFSDYIGRIMASYKLPVLLNPFGTLFNPFSIADDLHMLIAKKKFTRDDLHQYKGLYFSFAHYTGFSDTEAGQCLSRINESANHATEWLSSCRYLIVTFGTAWAYKRNANDKIVANCHKLPGTEFTKVLLPPGEIVDTYNTLIARLKTFNPALKIIFTLSPVRHWSDGAENNQLSKAILHYAIHELISRHTEVFYFPAYEIFMDELRDYRFYAADMLHPSEQGTRYVWERFSQTWIDSQAREVFPKLQEIINALAHKPVNAGSTLHKQFLEKTQKKMLALEERYPFLKK